MLFICTPRDRAASRPASRKVVKRGNRSFAVDLHCHVHTPAADELAKQSAKPEADPMARYANLRTRDHQNKLRADLDRKLTSIEQRLADMDKMGIDVQAISTSPLQYYYTVEPDLGRQTSRVINARLAEIRDAHPDRFVALGTVPMQAPELAVAELEYCMKTLGFRGIEISTHVNGVDLSDPRFEAVFAKAEGYYKPVEFVNSAHALTRAQKRAIIGGNAAKLLKINPRRKG